VIVDDASTDDSWQTLTTAAATTRLRLLVVRFERNRGPAAARNEAAARSRAAILSFTDDDCLPASRWLPSMLAAFDRSRVDIVQGRVYPDVDDNERSGPWDHCIWVAKPSPFFETCNVSYQRAAFRRVGGFDAQDRLLTPEPGRGFGEDADLAWRVIQSGGGSGFAADALVHHRFVPTTFRQRLRGQRHCAGFPALARRSPLVARWLRGGVFLSWHSAAFDAAVAGAAASVLLRRRWPLVAATPWLHLRWRDSLAQTHGDRSRGVVVLGQHLVFDLVTLVSLVEGSVRYRRLIL
jgi:GT2 family glycosyltransferase